MVDQTIIEDTIRHTTKANMVMTDHTSIMEMTGMDMRDIRRIHRMEAPFVTDVDRRAT